MPDQSRTFPALTHPTLTEDEWVVLEKFAQGATTLQISAELSINLAWVRHLYKLLRQKYGCENIAAVVTLVQAAGLPPKPKNDA